MDVCGVDYLEHGRAEWKTEDATSSGFSRGVARGDAETCGRRERRGRRFAVVYHLLSICAQSAPAPAGVLRRRRCSPWSIR